MCTFVLLVRPSHDWPLLVAANRDEMLGRPWRAPAAHWAQQPEVVGGLDVTGGGTWMAARGGLVAGVLNRRLSLGPAPGKRSRGDLPLAALRFGSARKACSALAGLDASQWRPFNLVVADREAAFLLRGLGEGELEAVQLGAGLHMVTAFDANDPASARVARHLPRFEAAPAPEPPDWAGWREILTDRSGPAGSEIFVPASGGFGTVCSSLLGVRADGTQQWLFADDGRFAEVADAGAAAAEAGPLAAHAGTVAAE